MARDELAGHLELANANGEELKKRLSDADQDHSELIRKLTENSNELHSIKVCMSMRHSGKKRSLGTVPMRPLTVTCYLLECCIVLA